MTDRLVIEITGALPEANKYATLAAAQGLADTLALELQQNWDTAAKVSVRAVRPGKKGTASTNTNGAATDNVRVSSSEAGHG